MFGTQPSEKTSNLTLVDMIKRQKRIVAAEKNVENEKYAQQETPMAAEDTTGYGKVRKGDGYGTS